MEEFEGHPPPHSAALLFCSIIFLIPSSDSRYKNEVLVDGKLNLDINNQND